MTDNKSICIYPWSGVAIRADDKVAPCCRFWASYEFKKEINTSIDFRNSKSWKNLQEKMLAGEKDMACRMCYDEEAIGNESMRTMSIKNRQLPTTTDILPIEFLDIAFNNLCNLACVSCSRICSTTWGTEDYKSGRLSKSTKVLMEHSESIVDNLDLSQLKYLKIFGGEPLMDQDKFIKLMKKLNLSQLRVGISTNGTYLPNPELKNLMDQCTKIDLFVSLDGLDSVNDWYRWPSKFSKVRENMDQYTEWWGDTHSVNLIVYSVINIYNIWSLDKFIKFINNYYPKWKIDWGWVNGNHTLWQQLSVIPKHQKELLEKQLIEWRNNIQENRLRGASAADPFSTSIQLLNYASNSSIEEFQKKSLELAKERNLDLFKMVPDIIPLFNADIDK